MLQDIKLNTTILNYFEQMFSDAIKLSWDRDIILEAKVEIKYKRTCTSFLENRKKMYIFYQFFINYKTKYTEENNVLNFGDRLLFILQRFRFKVYIISMLTSLKEEAVTQ